MQKSLYLEGDFYEVEKIITRKYFKNKKYYLIKWLYYPINQSTWETQSNLKHLQYLINDFEAQFPNTIDQNMYNIFCNEIKNKKTRKIKDKKCFDPNIHLKFLSKKRNNGLVPDEELNDPYLEGLKAHLHIKTNKTSLINDKEINNGLFIDLSNTNDKSDEDSINTIEKETNEKLLDENSQKILIRPKLL